MKTILRQLRKAPGSKPLIASLLLGVFVFVLALAQSWALHHSVCPEAGQPNHQCAATLLSSGQAAFSPASVTLPPPAVAVLVCALPEAPFLPVTDDTLLPSRGPPASLT